MDMRNISRRDFLRASALTAAGLVAAQCVAPPATQPPPAEGEAPAVPATEAPAAAPPAAEEVTLEIMAPASEYTTVYQEIWDVYQAENPGITCNVFGLNEDTTAAYQAKVAGGYLPHIENTTLLQLYVDKTNYQTCVNLGEIGFPWFDRWTFDVENAWSDMYGLPGPRTLEIFEGLNCTWVYHADLMEEAGLDPRKDVKTWDDMKRWLQAGTDWANQNDDVVAFWDNAWQPYMHSRHYPDVVAIAFPDGQREQQVATFMGEAKFNAPDSPYRHAFEFLKEATDKGWLAEGWWTKEWEVDMESAFIAKETVMCLHGPWIWDKVAAGNPDAELLGLPPSPPAEGQSDWNFHQWSPDINRQYFIRTGVEELPEWEQVKHAFFWFFSPKVVAMRAEAEGRMVTYKLDEPLEMQGPQWLGVRKDIGNPDGPLPDVNIVNSIEGWKQASVYAVKGSKEVWDYRANGNQPIWAGVMSGEMTVQDALDWAQNNWENDYEGLPL